MGLLDIFKANPRAKLERELSAKLERAMQLQRSGKIPEYARVTAEAAALEAELEKLDTAGVRR